jgi:hypothetical protein
MLWHRFRRPSLSGTRSRAAILTAGSASNPARPPSSAQANTPVRGRTPLLQHPSSNGPEYAGCPEASRNPFVKKFSKPLDEG